MEALPALALFCNILQLVEVAASTARWCKQIHEAGQTVYNIELESNARRLSETVVRLSTAIKASENRKPLERDELDIIAQVQECTNLSAELQAGLAKLKPKDPKGRVAIFKSAIKSEWNKRKITDLSDRLCRSQAVLHSLLLSNDWYVSRSENFLPSTSNSPLPQYSNPNFDGI